MKLWCQIGADMRACSPLNQTSTIHCCDLLGHLLVMSLILSVSTPFSFQSCPSGTYRHVSPSHLLSILSSALSHNHMSLEPLGGPGPGWELVRLLIKATDVISLERVAQAAVPLGNQFAMADAHGGENLPAAQQLFASKYQGSLYWLTPQPCFELESIACSSL